MTEKDLRTHEELYDAITDRCYEICDYLYMLDYSYPEFELNNGQIEIYVIDIDDRCTDILIMPYDKFASDNYIEEAKILRAKQLKIMETNNDNFKR